MKTRKRSHGHVAKKSWLIALILMAALSAIVLFQLTLFKEHKPKAAIVDSLYLLIPNEEFLSQAEQILREAGFEVEKFIGENVTVDLFKQLISMDLDLIIFRVHSAYVCFTEEGEALISVYFFSGEEYNESMYLEEQLLDEVVVGRVKIDGEEKSFFAITPRLILNSDGKLNDAIIIVDSCYGLNNTYMAKAFIKKGAKAYIAWDREVDALYADNATLTLLRFLYINEFSVEDAVSATLTECGKDPFYKSLLTYYLKNETS